MILQNDGEITNFEIRVINNDDNDAHKTIWALPNPASNDHTDQDQWKEGRVQILDELGEKEYQVRRLKLSKISPNTCDFIRRY